MYSSYDLFQQSGNEGKKILTVTHMVQNNKKVHLTSAAQQGTASLQRSQTSSQNSRSRQFLLMAELCSHWHHLALTVSHKTPGRGCVWFPPSHPPRGHLWPHLLLQKTMADWQL